MSTPYVGFGNDSLDKQPKLSIGDKIICPRCKLIHQVKGARDSHGDETDLLLLYDCGGASYLAGVGGRSVVGVPSDCSGAL